ncbi:hypothetical protein KALB_2937 [Kutzneria albida DSM 43870]|uniref:HTH tetR-type domain-containing protein n=2 Tax=Kutzneria TaxID=43356 RepID=W5W6B8_9PSEU|nr:hypothetical protein KALB_2937 [Kutzneria albida DSM 43870]
MIQSAAVLFRERGVAATALSEVIEHSGAPRGSIYHHFPGGKAQLVEETTRYAGEVVSAAMTDFARQHDPLAAVAAFVALWQEILESNDCRAGCPVLAAALDGDGEQAAAKVFAQWESLCAGMFRTHGVPARRARSLATTVVAAIEGAVVLSRAQRSTLPLQRVGRELGVLLRGASGGRVRSSPSSG